MAIYYKKDNTLFNCKLSWDGKKETLEESFLDKVIQQKLLQLWLKINQSNWDEEAILSLEESFKTVLFLCQELKINKKEETYEYQAG